MSTPTLSLSYYTSLRLLLSLVQLAIVLHFLYIPNCIDHLKSSVVFDLFSSLLFSFHNFVNKYYQYNQRINISRVQMKFQNFCIYVGINNVEIYSMTVSIECNHLYVNKQITSYILSQTYLNLWIHFTHSSAQLTTIGFDMLATVVNAGNNRIEKTKSFDVTSIQIKRSGQTSRQDSSLILPEKQLYVLLLDSSSEAAECQPIALTSDVMLPLQRDSNTIAVFFSHHFVLVLFLECFLRTVMCNYNKQKKH